MTVAIRSPASAASRRRGASRQQHPGQGDVLELAQITEVVLAGHALRPNPAEGVAHPALGQPGPCLECLDRAHVRGEATLVQALRLVELVERGVRIALRRGEPRHDHGPAAPVERAGHLPGLEQVLGGGVQIIPLAPDLAQFDVEIGRALDVQFAEFRRAAHRLLENVLRLAKSPLRHPDIRADDRTVDDVRLVSGPLKARHTRGVVAVRGFEVAARPAGEPQQRPGRAARNRIVSEGDIEHLPGVAHGGGHIAHELGMTGAIHRDRCREPAKLRLVDVGRLTGRYLQPPFGIAQAIGRGIELATGHQRADVGDIQHGPLPDHVPRERPEPAKQNGAETASQQIGHLSLDQVRRPREVFGGEGVANGIGAEPVRRVPLAGAAMPSSNRARLLRQGVRSQHVGKEVVVAVPDPLVVQPHHEQVAAFQRVEQPGAILPAGDGVAQRPTQAIEHGGLQQERPHRFRLPRQHLLDEVVHDVAIVAGEGLDEAGNVIAPAHREGGQLEPGDPAFRPLLQGFDIFRREIEVHRLAQERRRFRCGEAQIGDAQLGHLAAGAQAGEGELRILAGGDDQVQLRRQVIEQEGHRLVDRPRIDRVVVIQHENEAIRQGGELVEEGRQDRFDRRLRRLQHSCNPGTGICGNRLDRRHEVGEEPRRVVVSLVQRQPGAGVSACGDPFAHQGCLAKSGRRGDEGELAMQSVVQLVEQAGAGDDQRPDRGNVELGDQHGCRHRWRSSSAG
jgi:hypothetical protein